VGGLTQPISNCLLGAKHTGDSSDQGLSMKGGVSTTSPVCARKNPIFSIFKRLVEGRAVGKGSAADIAEAVAGEAEAPEGRDVQQRPDDGQHCLVRGVGRPRPPASQVTPKPAGLHRLDKCFAGEPQL
jgi:hypothetical protein